jgi:DNA (cytosine-5)-methyltransferase 1
VHKYKFTFIDLFAGIGGIRLAFKSAGGKCVFSSEWDKYAQQTYFANFNEVPDGDITQIKAKDIPNHDILTAGFPCQPFSIAGVSKHNALGNEHGFKHLTQGTLFFDAARVIQEKQPKAFLLENVKNLRNHDQGRTYEVIMRTLRDELGYHVFAKVIDAGKLVPQHRERIYIVGFKDERDFQFPDLPDLKPRLQDVLEKEVDPKYTLTDHLWEYLQKYAAKHKAKGNGFGFGLTDARGTARTLSARYYKDGSEILINQEGKNPRRLTPRECARLMGFPEEFKIVCSDTRAYKQFGNSVVVPVMEYVAREVVRCLLNPDEMPWMPIESLYLHRLLERSVEY